MSDFSVIHNQKDIRSTAHLWSIRKRNCNAAIPYIFLCGIIFLLTGHTGYAQRLRIPFDEGWKFHYGHAADPAKDFNYGITAIFAKAGKTDNTALALKFNDTGWRNLDLPHDWAVELPFVESQNFDVQSHGYRPVGGLFPETSIGWYRKNFLIPRKDSGQRFRIDFDGVFRDANVWINGHFLINNKSGYVGFSCDITDYINYDNQNVVTVRVDATQYEGWFYEGAGIYRHVWLNRFNNLHIAKDGVFTHVTIAGNTANVTIETEIGNKSLQKETGSMYSYIADRSGKKIVQSNNLPVSLNAGEEKSFKVKVRLSNPTVWSLEDPYLYRVVTIIHRNGSIIDSSSHRFGIRSVEIKSNGVFLNGKHIKLKGTNNHQDHAGIGSAMPDYLQYYRVRLLKELGSNAYRASHNAPTPELLDACDSLGMLVMDEQRLLNSSPEYMAQFEAIIKRDRNHPSVFMWSIGNEEGWVQTNSTGKRIAQTLLARQKELDPSRVSTYAADVPNFYTGVNEVIPVRGFNYRQFAVSDYHRDHPAQPIIGTEMGSTVTTRGIYQVDSIRAYVPDQDIVAPWWASTAETWWTLAAENDFWLGGFIWTGFDYHGEPTPFKWPNVSSHFGVMDLCGFPKNIYYYYQSWWTDKDVLHISPHWNWKGQEGKPIEVWVNSNADNVELFLNEKSLGKKTMSRNRHLKWIVNYAPGKVEAVAYKKNKKIIAHVETTGEPEAIMFTTSRNSMVADGKDAVVLNVSVVDKAGREVRDANNLIQFSLKGDARFIGVGNGDPSSHEPGKYFENTGWQRKLFNGKCQAIIQGGKMAGLVRIEAASTGLSPASVDIKSISR